MQHLKTKGVMTADEFRAARTRFIDHLVINHAKLKRCPRGFILGNAPLNFVATDHRMPIGTAMGIAEAVHSMAAWFKQ